MPFVSTRPGDPVIARRKFVRNLAGGLLALPITAVAQPPGKVYRIGWLREGALPIAKPFWETLEKSGWSEGRNVVVEARYAKALSELPGLAKELAQSKVDLIMTDGTPATRSAKSATDTIPIVFAIGADPVKEGLVASLARPETNLTGFTFGYYSDKQLQILKESVPAILHVAVTVREPDAGVMSAAAKLGIRVQAIPVPGPEALDSFFATARKAGVDAILFPNIAWVGPHEQRIAAESIRLRMPLIGTWRSFSEHGALLSYGPKPSSHWSRMAIQVDKILRGAKPADLPVEQPTQFDLAVNLKTAKALGVTIPQSVLLRAELIE